MIRPIPTTNGFRSATSQTAHASISALPSDIASSHRFFSKEGRERDMKTGYNRRNAMAASIAVCAALVLPASVNAQSGLTGNVMQRGVVRVAIAGGNAPYSSIDTNGEAIGYDVEIAKKFAASLKL